MTGSRDQLWPWNAEWARHRADRSPHALAFTPANGLAGETLSPAASQTRCDQLIGDLALQLVIAEASAIDDAITDGLRRLAEHMQIDRVTLWLGGQATASSAEIRALLSTSLVAAKLARGEPVWFSSLDQMAGVGGSDALHRHGIRSAAVFPLPSTNPHADSPGAVLAVSTTGEHDWPAEIVEQFRLLSAVIALGLARKGGAAVLPQTSQRPRGRETGDDVSLRPSSGWIRTAGRIVSDSAAMRATMEQVGQVAHTPATILLLGETGVGKEVVAQAIHDSSPRRHRPMIRVNCAAIPATLIESELFGRERGAFTGALARQAGRFELAQGSTIFLDEIGELPLEAQVKLLRVLQDKVVERLGGGGQTIKVDVRIIAATNRDLEQAVADKAFREDLYYRLNVFPITVPALRDRTEDIPALVWSFVEEFSTACGKRIDSIAKDSLASLQQYAWPGNVRELRNLVERAVILSTGPRLVIPGPKGIAAPPRINRLTDLEADHIRRVLESVGWRVRGAGGAAEILGLKPTTLDSRMEKLGVVRPERMNREPRFAAGAGLATPTA
jgi:formate hydrogenlyase transcriptional activator